MVLFGFFALVLVAVFWVNQAVILFDQLIADGHSAAVFLEFSLLSLPAVIAKVLPLSVFASAVYVTNRLMSESEMTVLQSVGFSPWRLARPALAYGILVALLMSVLTHVLVPQSTGLLKQREQEISGSISARLLREGTFLHPAKGITFYIREITTEGELRDVLLSDARQADREVIFTAERAYLLRDDEGSKLVMVAGLAQTLDLSTQRLSTTNFSDLVYDISGLIQPNKRIKTSVRQLSTPELLFDPQGAGEKTRSKPGRVMQETHTRFVSPLLCVLAALIGYASLMIGGYSRLGVTRQIIFAVFLIVIIEFSKGMVTEPVRDNAMLWPLMYAPVALGAAIVIALLAQSARNFRKPRATSGVQA
jgi:lipopolysaccharide export system permease protein